MVLFIIIEIVLIGCSFFWPPVFFLAVALPLAFFSVQYEIAIVLQDLFSPLSESPIYNPRHHLAVSCSTILWLLFLDLFFAFSLPPSLAALFVVSILAYVFSQTMIGKRNTRTRMIVVFLGGIFSTIIAFSVVYSESGILNSENEHIYQFSTCFYFSVVTWTTVGYGDFKPNEDLQMAVALEAMTGYFAMAICVWGMLSYEREDDHQERREQFLGFCESVKESFNNSVLEALTDPENYKRDPEV